jgi:hypothetical protein
MGSSKSLDAVGRVMMVRFTSGFTGYKQKGVVPVHTSDAHNISQLEASNLFFIYIYKVVTN